MRHPCGNCGEYGHYAKSCLKEKAKGYKVQQVVAPDPPDPFGYKVAALKAQGMSSAKVAEKLGVTIAKVNKFWVKLEGERKPVTYMK